MDFGKVNALYVFRPPSNHRGQDQVLRKCEKLKKEYAGTASAAGFNGSIPQIREFYEEIQRQLDTKGKWWGGSWERYGLKFEELDTAIRNSVIEFRFYRNLMIVSFSPAASQTLKEALFFKALESELEVVHE